jgi:hypothetical protein
MAIAAREYESGPDEAVEAIFITSGRLEISEPLIADWLLDIEFVGSDLYSDNDAADVTGSFRGEIENTVDMTAAMVSQIQRLAAGL